MKDILVLFFGSTLFDPEKSVQAAVLLRFFEANVCNKTGTVVAVTG